MLNKNKSVLLCDNSNSRDLLSNILGQTGCKIDLLDSSDNAIEKIRFTPYDIIFIHENFDPENKVLEYLQNMSMSLRRNIYLVLLSDNLETESGLKAFLRSVNMIVNKDDIKDILEILQRYTAENERFYMVYKESLAKIGKK